jgi:hypothetical protein
MNDLLSEAGQMESLDQALRWARTREPKVIPLETIPQDEYTHDVIFQSGPSEYLVFDAT